TKKMAVEVTAVKVVHLAFMIYFTNLVLIPRLLYQKKYFLFAVTYVFFVFVTSIIKLSSAAAFMNIPHFSVWNDFKLRIYDNIIPHYLLVSTGAAIKLLTDYGRAQRRLAEITKEKAESELKLLKSQINPHFLFNSLNSV